MQKWKKELKYPHCSTYLYFHVLATVNDILVDDFESSIDFIVFHWIPVEDTYLAWWNF